MKAIILAAGLGTRLLPLTAEVPKCLVDAGGRTILEHQLHALKGAGIDDIVLVGGYRFDVLKAFVAQLPGYLPRPKLVYNPFYAAASSIGSVWAAREVMDEPFLLMNGDTIFEPAILRDSVARMTRGVNLLVEPIHAAGPDDMLARVERGSVTQVSKTLPMLQATHRSLGVIAVADARGADYYREALDEVISAPGGEQAFHHAIVDHLARRGRVGAVEFEEDLWVEIDRPEDIESWLDVAKTAAVARSA